MSAEFAEQTGFVLAAKLMLPNTNYDPAAFAQGGIYAAVAGLVAGDLVAPELRVGLGLGGVLGAAGEQSET